MASAGRRSDVGPNIGGLAASARGLSGPPGVITLNDERTTSLEPGDLRALLHGLNNQLGVILAHAELLEAKALDEAQRARATEVVNAALSAMTISRALRQHA